MTFVMSNQFFYSFNSINFLTLTLRVSNLQPVRFGDDSAISSIKPPPPRRKKKEEDEGDKKDGEEEGEKIGAPEPKRFLSRLSCFFFF